MPRHLPRHLPRRQALLLGALVSMVACKKPLGGDDGKTYVVRTDAGETRVTLGETAIPDDFPPGMKLYPGAKVSGTARTAKSVVLSLSTDDACEAVRAFHRKQDGYEEISDAEVEGWLVLHLRHETSGKDVQVLVKSAGRRCEISLVAPLS